jgi:hypothetical protein
MEAQDNNDNLMFVIAFLRDKDLCHVYSEALHTPPPSQMPFQYINGTAKIRSPLRLLSQWHELSSSPKLSPLSELTS